MNNEEAQQQPTSAADVRCSAMVRRFDDLLTAATDMEFQRRLASAGVADPRGYIWNDGDPLYRGNPISGRVTAAECRAILKMRTEEETHALLSA